MNSSEKFVLVDGYVSLDNTQLYVSINSLKKDFKKRGGLLGIFFVLIIISLFNNFKKETYFESVFQYIDFGLRVIGILAIIAVFWYLIFNRKSKKKLIINEINKIELEKQEFETELTIKFSNKREIDLSFRNLENQLKPFIEALKKRNSRIQIITI